MTWNKRSVLLASVLAALCAAAGTVRAEQLQTTVELGAKNEVPPNDSSATGEAEVSLDTESRVLQWKVSYSGLTGPAMGAHFHGPTDPGKNAGIVVPFTNGLASPIEGKVTLTEAQMRTVRGGNWYVNIHTARHPGGELRGQLVWK